MSPYFVKLFKKENKCSCCKASKKDGYSVCAKHLKSAGDQRAIIAGLAACINPVHQAHININAAIAAILFGDK